MKKKRSKEQYKKVNFPNQSTKREQSRHKRKHRRHSHTKSAAMQAQCRARTPLSLILYSHCFSLATSSFASSMESDDEKAIRQLCVKLTPGLLLSSPSRWRAVEDEEQLTDNANTPAKERLIQNAKEVIEWVENEVPKQLRNLISLLEGRRTKGPISIETRALIAIALSRFISYRKRISQPFSINVWTSNDRNLFTSPKNDEIARKILHISIWQNDRIQKDSLPVLPLDVVNVIFKSYIRPLFTTTPSASINEASGRAKQTSKIHTAGSGPREEETVWKGGDLKRAAQMNCLGQDMLISDDGSPALRSRHMGIGAESILYMCCKSVELAATEQDDNIWNEYWTEILPPLLQLLEDPSPRFRLAGTQILSATLLAGYEDPKQRQKIGTLLLRTGVAQLFRSVLITNLTFLSVQIAGALLQSTAEAYMKVVRITTEDIVSKVDQHQSYLISDGGRARFEQLSQLVEDGVLRVWAYAPSTSTLFEFEQVEDVYKPENIILQEQTNEDVDVINASISVLKQAAHTDNLGTGIVRYLDVSLEFLLQQLSGLEAKVERARGKVQSQIKALPFINFHRQLLAAEAILSMLRASSDCPAVEVWSTKCITTCAKCWIIFRQHGFENAQSKRLQLLIHEIVQFFYQQYKTSTEKTIEAISELDPPAFRGFCR